MAAFRPGGLSMTAELLNKIALPHGASILDVGCGCGDTVEYLKQAGFKAVGIDKAPGGRLRPYIIEAAADALPFEAAAFDAVICECCLSLFGSAEAALAEMARVLKKEAFLLLSDLYSARGGARFTGEVRRLYTKTELEALLAANGFITIAFEDRLYEMKSYAAQLIMDMGAEAFYKSMGGTACDFRAAGCSYYSLIAVKEAVRADD